MASNIALLRREALAQRVTGWAGDVLADIREADEDEARAEAAIRFEVDGAYYTRADMLRANADDVAFCDWCEYAQPGDLWPGFLCVRCTTLEAIADRAARIAAREAEIACEDWWRAERQELRRQRPAPRIVNREPYPAHIDMYEHLAGRSGVLYRGD